MTRAHCLKRYLIGILIFLITYSTPVTAAIKKEIIITGKTMGTTYKVKYITDKKHSKPIWQKRIDILLKQINKRLSMYDPKSELSTFNQAPLGNYDSASDDFFNVLSTGQTLHKMTQGAWDGTIKPLVDLWGFGTKEKPVDIPIQSDIKQTLTMIGFDHIQINSPQNIIKQKPVTLDFGSIAKGYGVDAIAKLFITSRINDVLVEIGGELFASGRNKSGKTWSVGISRPDKVFAKQTLYKVIQLNNAAIATSGNYRNFYAIKGKSYSHIINPKTGYPVQNSIVSASVISKNCTFADGLATALMVMNVKKGIELVNSLDGTECLIVQKAPGKEEQEYIDHTSKNFNALLLKQFKTQAK